MEKNINVNAYIPNGYTEISKNEEYGFYLFGKPESKILLGIRVTGKNVKKVKISFHVRYLSQNDYEKNLCWVEKNVEYIEKLEKEKKQQKENIKNEKKNNLSQYIKIGDIFVSSWGYEQTNVDAYQVIDIIGNSKAIMRPIYTKMIESTGYDSSKVKPVKDSFKQKEGQDEFTCTIKINPNFNSDNNVTLRGGGFAKYEYPSKWDGKRTYHCSHYH